MDHVAKCTKTPPKPISLPNPLSYSPSSSSGSPPSVSPPHSPPPPVVLSPCAACKILRRRCVDKCVLAPYFPPTDPLKFTIAHRVFGASNIIKFLQELPESQRTDAVSSMVYEANARLRDPVYGSAGAICQLQKQVSDLQAQLAKARAEVANMQHQQANLLALICMEMQQSSSSLLSSSLSSSLSSPMEPIFGFHPHHELPLVDTSCFLDDANLSSPWEPLWT